MIAKRTCSDATAIIHGENIGNKVAETSPKKYTFSSIQSIVQK